MKKGQHQRQHKRTVKGKTFKAGRGCHCRGNKHTIKCPIYGSHIFPPTPYHHYDEKSNKWVLEKCNLPTGRREYWVVTKTLESGKIITRGYRTNQHDQNKLADSLREKLGPSAGISKVTGRIR